MKKINELKKKWHDERIISPLLATNDEILFFELNNKIILPSDLRDYFKYLNGTGSKYDDNMFQFYPISQINKIEEEYEDWKGTPNYKEIINNLKECDKYFVFANYNFHLFSYAIKLYNKSCINNEVIVVCGGEYKKIADSFEEFIDVYLTDDSKLQL